TAACAVLTLVARLCLVGGESSHARIRSRRGSRNNAVEARSGRRAATTLRPSVAASAAIGDDLPGPEPLQSRPGPARVTAWFTSRPTTARARDDRGRCPTPPATV